MARFGVPGGALIGTPALEQRDVAFEFLMKVAAGIPSF
jgi:hypothetical protein